jgi:hypothetical protein
VPQLPIRRSHLPLQPQGVAHTSHCPPNSKARSSRDIHQAKHFGFSPPTQSTRLHGLWLAVTYSAHRSATMAPIQSTEFDLTKCFKGEQQLVYVYEACTGIDNSY